VEWRGGWGGQKANNKTRSTKALFVFLLGHMNFYFFEEKKNTLTEYINKLYN
jgi:hypothetical protein